MLSPVAVKEALLPFLPAVGAGLPQADGGCSCWNWGRGGLPHTRAHWVERWPAISWTLGVCTPR